LSRRVCITASNSPHRHREDDQHNKEGSPQTQPLLIVCAAARRAPAEDLARINMMILAIVTP
jgi:hypothetical protein